MSEDQMIKEMAALQENLDQLSAGTIDDLRQYLSSKADLFLMDKVALGRFLHLLQASINARPTVSAQYTKLLTTYKELIGKFFTSDNLYLIFRNCKIALLTLLDLKLFNVSSLLKFDPHNEDLHFYFAPEILQYTQQLYGDSRRKFPVREFSNYIYNTMNIQEHIQTRSQLSNPDPLSTIIRNNDLTSLQELANVNPSVLESKIPYSFYEPVDFINTPMISSLLTLPEFDAVFKSTSIFQFLIEKVDITNFNALYAVAGGNFDIIHILEDSHVQFNTSECLCIAIRFHYNEIAHYIHQTLQVPYSKESFLVCIEYNNLTILPQVLNELQLDQSFLDAALEIAVDRAYFDVMKYIFTLYQTINSTCIDLNLSSSLNRACRFGYLAIVKYLIEEKNVSYTSKEFTGLYFSSQYGFLDVVTYLCSLTKIDLNIVDITTKDPPILVAAYFGHLDVVKFLASQNGINLNYHNPYNNRTIAFRAAEGEHFDVLKFVCEVCIDETIHCCDHNGWNLLSVASQFNSTDIVRFLIEQKGFDVNEPNHPPIVCAIQNQCIDVVKYFLSLPNCELVHLQNGWTAIMTASFYQVKEALQLLIDSKKVDINAQMGDGTTALMLAAKCGNMEIIKILLENGANPEIADNSNMKANQFLSPDKQQIYQSLRKH